MLMIACSVIGLVLARGQPQWPEAKAEGHYGCRSAAVANKIQTTVR